MNASLKHIKQFFFDPEFRFLFLGKYGFLNSMDDREYLEKLFYISFHKKLNLDNPKTYSEKLQWIKLYDHNSDYTIMADKYLAKEFVESKIGNGYIIPTLGVWDNVEDIDFEKLPNQFVLKCTHDSHGLIICKDKRKLDIQKCRHELKKALKTNYYYKFREWPYKDIKPRIIAEKYMEDSTTKDLRDYKFFCFAGEVKLLFVATDRQDAHEETKFDFFDLDFNHLDIVNGHPNAASTIEKPKSFEQMIELAKVLSAGIPHVRVDFYDVDGKPYFGEMTFFHWSGLKPFEPEEWDYKMGEWLILPNKKNNM